MTNSVGAVQQRVRRAWQSNTFLRGAARFGLGSRALVYVTLTVLVAQVALGERQANTDQGSGIKVLGQNLGGTITLYALVVGVVCYAAWRIFTALTSTSEARQRWLALVEGLAYLPFGYMAVGVLAGNSAAAQQGPKYRGLAAQVMQHTAGRWLIGAVGLGVVVVGGFLASQGIRASFMHDLRLPDRPGLGRAVRIVGAVGSIGRGAVFVLAGVLVVYAAVTVEPAKTGGVDAALDAVRALPGGRYVLVLTALALLAFALLTVAEAIWREVAPEDSEADGREQEDYTSDARR